jgi:hypothetical protein
MQNNLRSNKKSQKYEERNLVFRHITICLLIFPYEMFLCFQQLPFSFQIKMQFSFAWCVKQLDCFLLETPKIRASGGLL